MGRLVDELPLFVMYGMGAWLFVPTGWYWTVLFIVYAIASNLWFAATICSNCVNYGKNCPSGYGKWAARLTRKGSSKRFRRAFTRNIPVVALGWILPLIGGIHSLVLAFGKMRALAYAAIPLIIYCIVAFYVVPEGSREQCRRCKMRNVCPGARITGTGPALKGDRAAL